MQQCYGEKARHSQHLSAAWAAQLSYHSAVDAHTAVLAVAIISVIAALGFTMLPVIPGTLFILAGAIVCGFIDGWSAFAWWFWVGQVALTVVYLVVDQAVQAISARRAGTSTRGIVGGMVGVFIAPLALAPISGPFALLIGPALGAVVGTIIGELSSPRPTEDESARRSIRSIGAWALFAYAAGTVGKLVVVSGQAAWLVLTVW